MKDDSFDCTLIAHLRIFLLFYRLLYCLILPENRLFFGIWKVVEIEKDLVKNVEKLKELGFEITLHDKMPDVVLYREDKNWIYFIESVTSVGPMDPKRILEITEMTKDVTAGKIFVTAFLDFKTYKKFAEELAWETEVWIAEMPEHMIHLNGDRFMGPR